MGFVSPIASSQCSTIGWLTGWRPARGLLLPSALTRSAALWMSSTVMTVFSSRKRSSPWNPRHLQARRSNHFAHHLVHTAAERDHQIPLRLTVEPLQQLGGVRFGRLAVLADDLFGQSADVLNALGAKHFGRRGVGDVDGFTGRGNLPVEQLVDPPDRMNLTEGAAHVLVVDRCHAVTAGLGRPRVYAVVDAGEPARGAKHHPLVVQLGGDQSPAAVLLADQHVSGNPNV